jgi:NAD(P)H-dependent flavin oxidoreductase YrpB (nitropropane dioxygenase family)
VVATARTYSSTTLTPATRLRPTYPFVIAPPATLRHCTPCPRLDTKGALPELIDIIIEEKAALFVCAVGVPPKWAVDKLHAAGIPCMNMIGAPKHVHKACAVGMDLICAQGGEGGGHTGDVATSVLIPKVVDLCQQYTSPLTGRPVQVVAAGGIFDGRGLAMSISMGAQAVWVGTRMICAAAAQEGGREGGLQRHGAEHHLYRPADASAEDAVHHGLAGEPQR